MKNHWNYVLRVIKHPNYKNLELNEVVNYIRKILWVGSEEVEEEIAIILEQIENKISNEDHAINKKITLMLKTGHVPKDIWDDIWFLKIRDFRNFKSVLTYLIQLDNKVDPKKQIEYIRQIKESNWLTIHSCWRSYLYGMVMMTKTKVIKKYDECVIFDIEFDMQNGREQIIEISALKIRNNKIIGTFSRLAKNNFRLSSKFMEITKIKPYQLKYKPSDKKVLNDFFEFIKNTDVLVGFAISANDIPMLKRFDINKKINKFDLQKYTIFDMQRYLAESKHEQRSLVYYYEQLDLNLDIDENEFHRAETDCMVMYEIFLHLDYREVKIEKIEV